MLRLKESVVNAWSQFVKVGCLTRKENIILKKLTNLNLKRKSLPCGVILK